MADEKHLIEISRALGRIEGSIEARFDQVDKRLDFQDQQRDILVEKIQALADAPRVKRVERKKAIAKWSAGAAASIIVSFFVAIAKGCVGR
jgi:hypothetical protein